MLRRVEYVLLSGLKGLGLGLGLGLGWRSNPSRAHLRSAKPTFPILGAVVPEQKRWCEGRTSQRPLLLLI